MASNATNLIGAVFTRIILVAYAAKVTAQEEAIRLISARKATPGERKLYEENAAN